MHKVLVSQDDLQLHGGFRGGFSRFIHESSYSLSLI